MLKRSAHSDEMIPPTATPVHSRSSDLIVEEDDDYDDEEYDDDDGLERERSSSFSAPPPMKKDAPALVLPWLLLGSSGHAFSRLTRRTFGVTHNLCLEQFKYQAPGVQYLQVPLSDRGASDLFALLPQCMAFIDSARQTNGRVLVNCFAGINRACSVVLWYLVSEMKWTLRQAWNTVRSKRPIVNPVMKYRNQLLDLEFDVHGANTFVTTDWEAEVRSPSVGMVSNPSAVSFASSCSNYTVNSSTSSSSSSSGVNSTSSSVSPSTMTSLQGGLAALSCTLATLMPLVVSSNSTTPSPKQSRFNSSAPTLQKVPPPAPTATSSAAVVRSMMALAKPTPVVMIPQRPPLPQSLPFSSSIPTLPTSV